MSYEGQSLTTAAGGPNDFLPRLWATRKIGYLLTQIRLHGENPESVQAIVDLSVRYGIVTPYTSYLITEDDILTRMAGTGWRKTGTAAGRAMSRATRRSTRPIIRAR